MPLNFNELIFLPRVLHIDRTYVEYLEYPVMNFASNFFYLNRTQDLNLQRAVYAHTENLIVDPRTAMFQYGGHRGKPTYRKLSYSIPDNQVLSSSDLNISSLRNYVNLVIQEQISREATIIVPPYFLISSHSDEWFDICVNSARISRELRPNDNILMFLLIKNRILLNQSELESIIRTLENLEVNGFYILVSDLDESRISRTYLNSYVNLIRQLSSSERIVLPGQVGRLGLVLAAAGAAGYGAGFEKLDSFSESSLSSEGTGGGRTTRYYIHNCLLHIYAHKADAITDTNVSTLEYPCNCNHCDGRNPTEIASKERTLHFIDLRLRELRKLTRIEPSERINYVANLFSEAINLCLEIETNLASSDFGSQIFNNSDYEHLVTLRDAILDLQ